MDIPDNVILRQMEVGPMQNFQYFVGDKQSKEIAVVDPAWDAEFLCAEAKNQDLKITAALITHGHYDHVNALDDLLSRHDVPAYVSQHESHLYKPKHKNIVEVEPGQMIKIGNISLECIFTPGHTPGCQCFKYENICVTGDTFFIDGCGRCDLPGSDPKKMYHSLYDVIMKLPSSTVMYTGHDYGPTPYATLEEQKKTNPYLLSNSEEDFLRQRMGL